jgi:hypothetical protein
MPRRHLRMLRAVNRIDLQQCVNEATALAKESELLRASRPKYNRAGIWPAPVRYFAWQPSGESLRLRVTEETGGEWRTHGPMGRAAFALISALARLLWVGMYPQRGFAGLPVGWSHGTMREETIIACGGKTKLVCERVEQLMSGQTEAFGDWLMGQYGRKLQPFEKALAEADFEVLVDLLQAKHRLPKLKSA